MDYIREFLSSPNLPDIIAYLMFLTALITQGFIKSFVKKDNKNTIFKVDKRAKSLEEANAQLKAATNELHDSKKDVKRLEKRVARLEKLINKISSNSAELVKKGVARDVAKELSSSDEIVVEDLKGEN